MVAIKILTNNYHLYHDIMCECKTLLTEMEAVPPMQIYREQNVVVDRLAKEGTIIPFSMQPATIVTPPPFVLNYVLYDYSGKTFSRIVNRSNSGQNMTMTDISFCPQGRDVTLNSNILASPSGRSTNPPSPTNF